MNRRSKIYTKTGDKGTTGLANGTRVEKDNERIIALGAVDELNCAIGCILAQPLPDTIKKTLLEIQKELFELGASLSLAKRPSPDIKRLETAIDLLDSNLTPLRSFILPGGTSGGSAAHLARGICRRAEISLWHLNHSSPVEPKNLIYLNRLSDYLFVVARSINQEQGISETPWLPEDH
ncbi:MAG: cob(I)yrinic acid a,c-diamide adenosyltransferase [Pseudomonadota bacterium]|nr:cob(I)yrinic acid a,c-diamide adenosyltransferase [Pseudomonadota bacterium]